MKNVITATVFEAYSIRDIHITVIYCCIYIGADLHIN